MKSFVALILIVLTFPTADKWGLVTLKQVTVGKGKNRIIIAKQ